MIEKPLTQPQLNALCGVLANTNLGLTESEIRLKLSQCCIYAVDKGGSRNAYGYTLGLSKKDWLYSCFANEINSSQSFTKVYAFIENALDPACYTSAGKRDKYRYLLDEVNKILVLVGLEVQETGKIRKVVKAETLDEVDRRIKSLDQKLRDRRIHAEVTKYCIRDYLRKDYHDAVFEAAKGVAQRVRDITGLEKDGGELFQQAFARKDPYLYFNLLRTESEISEFIGLKELLESIFHLIRNPEAHTPKINWTIDEEAALDMLTLISVAHKYLDKCNPVPYKLPKD